MVRAEGAAPPSPYGQPDRKKTFSLPLVHNEEFYCVMSIPLCLYTRGTTTWLELLPGGHVMLTKHKKFYLER